MYEHFEYSFVSSKTCSTRMLGGDKKWSLIEINIHSKHKDPMALYFICSHAEYLNNDAKLRTTSGKSVPKSMKTLGANPANELNVNREGNLKSRLLI